jgi:hypothetical protein
LFPFMDMMSPFIPIAPEPSILTHLMPNAILRLATQTLKPGGNTEC